jgi:hypothetical protein
MSQPGATRSPTKKRKWCWRWACSFAGTTTRRNAFSEWFAIDSNKIRSIYSAMFYPPPEAPVPNWPPYDGNWLLPPAFAAPAPPGPGR